MITCIYGGRLGNLLLSLYTCFWYARKNGIPFDQVKFNSVYNRSPFGMDTPQGVRCVDYLKKNAPILEKISKNFIPMEDYPEIEKASKHCVINELPGKVVIGKYCWHYPKNSADVELFRALFRNESLCNKLVADYAEYFKNYNVALHVRRTDYKIWQGGKHLESAESIQAKLDNLKNTTVVCFSDDIDWCQETLKETNGNKLLFHSSDKNAPECNDMLLMSCFGNILSGESSSFSYCAKLMNPHIATIPKRLVFNPGNIN